jgi:hypothetical protein
MFSFAPRERWPSKRLFHLVGREVVESASALNNHLCYDLYHLDIISWVKVIPLVIETKQETNMGQTKRNETRHFRKFPSALLKCERTYPRMRIRTLLIYYIVLFSLSMCRRWPGADPQPWSTRLAGVSLHSTYGPCLSHRAEEELD